MKLMSDYELDPRVDLDAQYRDHQLWMALLATAHSRDLDLWGALHCLRCGGASLERDKDFGMLIRPGEWNQAEYNQFRARHLAPRKAQVVEVLKAAATMNKPATTQATLPTQSAQQSRAQTLEDSVRSRVKALEPRLAKAGWAHSEIWSTEPWLDDRNVERQSVYAYLLKSSAAEVGEITSQHVEFRYRVNGRPWPKLLMRPGAVATLFEDAPDAPQHSATMKKEAV